MAGETAIALYGVFQEASIAAAGGLRRFLLRRLPEWVGMTLQVCRMEIWSGSSAVREPAGSQCCPLAEKRAMQAACLLSWRDRQGAAVRVLPLSSAMPAPGRRPFRRRACGHRLCCSTQAPCNSCLARSIRRVRCGAMSPPGSGVLGLPMGRRPAARLAATEQAHLSEGTQARGVTLGERGFADEGQTHFPCEEVCMAKADVIDAKSSCPGHSTRPCRSRARGCPQALHGVIVPAAPVGWPGATGN